MATPRSKTRSAAKRARANVDVAGGHGTPPSALNRRKFLTSALVTAVVGAATSVAAPHLSVASIRSRGGHRRSSWSDWQANAGPWLGAVTDSGATVKVRVAGGAERARLVVARDERLKNGVVTVSPASVWVDPQRRYEDKIIAFEATGLGPATEYGYGVELNGRLVNGLVGRFRTTPLKGTRTSFRFALSSCARQKWMGGSRPEAYRAIAANRDLLFFLHLGDLHYKDNHDEELRSRLEDYDDASRRDGPDGLFTSLPVVYVWDDHDFLGNNSAGADPRRSGAARYAREAYGIYVPHYETVRPDDGIYQTFEVGRVLFLLTDTRSQRSSRSGSRRVGTVLGAAQKAWLKGKLLDGKSADLIVWVNSIPWIGQPKVGDDSWAGFPEERRELAEFIVANGIRNICMVSGDAHMVAIDDGPHAGYAAGGCGGFPVFHAAALESRGSKKGGPYSHGSDGGGPGNGIPGRRQFGLFEVVYESPDTPPRVQWTAIRARKKSVETTVLLRHEFAAERTFDGF